MSDSEILVRSTYYLGIRTGVKPDAQIAEFIGPDLDGVRIPDFEWMEQAQEALSKVKGAGAGHEGVLAANFARGYTAVRETDSVLESLGLNNP